jgi:hypothetical protein
MCFVWSKAEDVSTDAAVVLGNVLLVAGSKAQAESVAQAQVKKKRFLRFFLTD